MKTTKSSYKNISHNVSQLLFLVSYIINNKGSSLTSSFHRYLNIFSDTHRAAPLSRVHATVNKCNKFHSWNMKIRPSLFSLPNGKQYSNCIKGYCTSGPYFWRFCAFSQKIKQPRTKYPMDLVRNVPRNSKITILLQCRPLLWSYSEKCAKINIFHVLSHKSITTWVSETPVQ